MTSPIDIRVDMDGVPDLLTRMNVAADKLQAGLEGGAQYLKSKVAVYPAPRHAPQPFKNAKQRRGFFARLNKGDIEVPYMRGTSPTSQKLGQSWGVVVGRMEAVIGTRVSYAPLVQRKADQTRYHKATGWVTVESVQKEYGTEAVNIVKRVALADIIKTL